MTRSTPQKGNMQNGAEGNARVGTSLGQSSGSSGREGDLEAPRESSGEWYKQWWKKTDSEGGTQRGPGFSGLGARRSVVWASRSSAVMVWEGFESIKHRASRAVDRMNTWADSSWVGRFFTFRDRQARLGKELQAGVISFLMIVYTLTLNPTILSSTGGTCDAQKLCGADLYDALGESCLEVSTSDDVLDCLVRFKRSVTTATAIASLISSFLMGFFANLPMGLAPGIGINVYFAYQVVGQGVLTYEQALVAVFLEGWIFIILSLTGVRGAVMKYMPRSIAFSGSVGMGLLLAYTGLRSLGAVAFDPTTLTTLGGCPRDAMKYVFYSSYNPGGIEGLGGDVATTGGLVSLDQNASYIQFPLTDIDFASPTVHVCDSKEMQSATMWLGIAGGIISSLLLVWRVKGALFYGVLFVTIVAWIPGHAASYLGAGSPIPGGEYRLQSFEQIVALPSLSMTGLEWDWSAVTDGHFWFVLFTFLYIDVLDCTGILISMAFLLDTCLELDFYGVDEHDEISKKKEAIKEANNGIEPHPYQQLVSQKKEFKGQQWAFLSDGIGIVVSSMVGISPVTVYLENAAGIEEGGRTGIVPLTVSFFFFVALFFSPILSSIPPYATASALILVGIMLMAHADHIPWDEPKEAIPAFLTIIVMPFSYSVAYGILAGICMYIILRIPGWAIHLYQMATVRLRRGNRPSMDDNASIASSKRSGKGARAQVRKFFGDVGYAVTEKASHLNMGISSDAPPGGARGQPATDSMSIPERRMTHSQSHAGFGLQGWENRNNSQGSSPARASLMSSPGARPSWGRTMSLSDRAIGQPRGRLQGLNFPTLNNSMKIASSEAVLNAPDNASMASVDGESGQGLFGDFKMLDLDLGGSGSSEEDDEIMLENDGSLSLVPRKTSQLDSIDMSFKMPSSQSQERGTADMETISEPTDPGQEGGGSEESMHANRHITFAMAGEDGNGADAGAAPGRRGLGIRQATERSIASTASLSSGGLSRSLSLAQSTSVGRGMVRTESAAALRLKDLFAAAEADSDKSEKSGS